MSLASVPNGKCTRENPNNNSNNNKNLFRKGAAPCERLLPGDSRAWGTEMLQTGEEGFGYPKLSLAGQQHSGLEAGGTWEGSPNFAASETDVLVS